MARLELIKPAFSAYDAVRGLQEDSFRKVNLEKDLHILIFCKHQPVITCGREYQHGDILANSDISLRHVDRGGGVTYHGPGQLTVYPVFNLNLLKKDIRWFVFQLEETVIKSLAVFNLHGQRRIGLPGVWVNEKKICSIGIGVSRWITFHGISLNINSNDMAAYSLIRPCGSDSVMTCLENEIGRGEINRGIVENTLLGSLRSTFWPAGIGLIEERTEEALR